MKRFIVVALLCFCASSSVAAQTANHEKLLRALLDVPAPPFKKSIGEAAKARSDEFYLRRNVPPDDAPLADLFDYWARHKSNSWQIGALKPNEKVLRRMIEAVREQPEKLADIVSYLPENAESVAFVRRTLAEASEKLDDDQRATANSWLKYHSDANVGELLEAAQKTKDRKDGRVKNEDELGALAAVDWERAKPIVERLANDASQIRSAIFAKRLMYERALKENEQSAAERLRGELKAAVENRDLPARARDTAMDALFLNEDWQGRADWYLSLFADETLFKLEDDSGSFTGLTTPMLVDPEKWTPLMIELVGNQNQTIHNAAARNLLTLAGGEAPADAMRALLPWLTNPDWALDAGGERQEFIAALVHVDLPESVPGLIHVLTSENVDNRSVAAALARYKDARAVPALKLALEKESSEYNRNFYINAIIACGGLTDDEQVQALETFAAHSIEQIRLTAEQIQSTDNIRRNIGGSVERNGVDFVEPTSVSAQIAASIGRYLSEQTEVSDGVAIRLLERIEVLEKENPRLAAALGDIARRWQGRIVDAALLRSIKNGKADLAQTVTVLARREKLRERVGGELAVLLGTSGAGDGFAAVLGGYESEMLRVLSGQDAAAQTALLAAARLVRADLPVAAVAELLADKNKLLALAAERYLEAEDSSRAREFVLARYPNQAKILGARDSFAPLNRTDFNHEILAELFESVSGTQFVNSNFEPLQKLEDQLGSEFSENKNLREIFAFLNMDDRGQRIVRIYDDKATLTVHDDPARYRERVLQTGELEALRSSYETNRVADQPPIIESCNNYHGTCTVQSFLALKPAGGRRVFVQSNSPDLKPLAELNKLFDEFAAVKAATDYNLSKLFPRLEIVFADDQHEAKYVWKNADDLRVLVKKREDQSAAVSESIETNSSEDEDEDELSEAAQEAARLRERQLETERAQIERYAGWHWRIVKNNQLGEASAQPTEISFLPGAAKLPETFGFSFYEPSWQVRAGDSEIRTGDDERGGLWKLSRQRAPVQIRAGKYGYTVVTPDGKWAITTRETNDENAAARRLVRINLQTNQESTVNLPASPEGLYPMAFVRAHNKVVVARNTTSQGAKEFYLLDAQTNRIAPVKGEFRPLDEQEPRPLQTAKAQPHLFWAAIYDEQTNSTAFGLYDAHQFAFKPLLKLPKIRFTSMDTWVDEAENKLYFVYAGQVLSLPLPPAAK